MLQVKPIVLVIAAFYLLVIAAIGIWSLRRTRTASDFFIAGKGVGLIAMSLASMAAGISGFVFIGGPGLTYHYGIGTLWITFSGSFTTAMGCWVVGKRLRLLAEARSVMTIPDAVAARFGSRAITGLSAFAILFGCVGYLGVQFQALGQISSLVFGMDFLTALVLGAGVVLFYSAAGGMIAGVYTDVFQGTIMVIASATTFFFAIHEAGGWTRISTALMQSRPEFLSPFGLLPAISVLSWYFVFSIGSLGQPHQIHKFYFLDDPRKLKWTPVTITLTQMLSVLIWMGIGVAVPALIAQGRLAPLSRADDASLVFLAKFTPDLLAGIVMAGILAAIMSTANSFLNIGAAALVRDLPQAFGWKCSNEFRWGRIVTIFLSVLAVIFVVAFSRQIAIVGTFAWGIFASAIVPVVALGLNWKRATRAGAAASLVTALTGNIVLESFARIGWLHLPIAVPAAIAMILSILVFIVVSFATRSGSGEEIAEDVRLVMKL